MKKDAQAQNQPSARPRRRLLRGAAAIGAAAAGYGVLRELNASPVPSPSATLGTERAVQQLVPRELAINDGDMRLYRALPQRVRHNVGPFVFVDHYRHKSLRGLGDTPHPHAGIEVISYLLQGSMEHRDSMGFRDKLLAGLINGQQGPMQLASGAMFAYTRLQAKASARFDVPEGKELAVYVGGRQRAGARPARGHRQPGAAGPRHIHQRHRRRWPARAVRPDRGRPDPARDLLRRPLRGQLTPGAAAQARRLSGRENGHAGRHAVLSGGA